jgi:hypothetical protein
MEELQQTAKPLLSIINEKRDLIKEMSGDKYANMELLIQKVGVSLPLVSICDLLTL